MRLTLNQDFYRNLFTHDLVQRRKNRYLLHSADEIRGFLLTNNVFKEEDQNIDLVLPTCDFSKIAYVAAPGSFHGIDNPAFDPYRAGRPQNFTNQKMLEYMTATVPKVVQLMNEFPGQVVVGGGSLYSFYRTGAIAYDGDVDVFICASSPIEAERIVQRGMDLLEGAPIKVNEWYVPETSPMATTGFDMQFMPGGLGMQKAVKVQFIRRLYPAGRPDMIIGAFDIHSCQIFWSISTGIQCTTAALVSLITQSFPLDLSRRSFSFGQRLKKYIDRKYLNLLLPGVNLENPAPEFGWKNTQRGKQEVFTQDAVYKYQFGQTGDAEADYVEPQDDDEKPKPKYEPEPEEEPGIYRNLNVLLRESLNVSIKLKSYKDFCTGNFDLVEALFGSDMNFGVNIKRSVSSIKAKFKSEEDYKEFAMALYINGDKRRAREIWEINKEKLVGYLRHHFCGGVEPSTYWKVDDPGAQGFGQNFPRPIAPVEYYGGLEHYSGLRVGLRDFSCWTIRQMTIRYGLPRDLFRLLCSWTFHAEGQQALQELNLA